MAQAVSVSWNIMLIFLNIVRREYAIRTGRRRLALIFVLEDPL